MTNSEFVRFHDSMITQIQQLSKTIDDFAKQTDHKHMDMLADALWEARQCEKDDVTAQILIFTRNLVEMVNNADS